MSRLLSLFVIGAVAVVLAGCGSGSAKDAEAFAPMKGGGQSGLEGGVDTVSNEGADAGPGAGARTRDRS